MDNNSTVELIVKGNPYSLVKTAKISKSLDAIGGSFEFTIANDQIINFPIKPQDDIVVKINGEQVVSGLVNIVNPSYSSDASGQVVHELKISGFDYTLSAVQAGVFANAQYASPISLKKLIEKILKDNGINSIKVVDNSGRPAQDLIIPENIEISANSGDTLFSFMDKYAKLLNVLLGSDGKGGITIDDATNKSGLQFSGITLKNKIGKRDNVRILAGSSTRDYTNRFGVVMILSQNDGGGTGDKGSGIRGLEFDSGVRKEGAKVIISDTVLDKERADAVAVWEVRKRQANSTIYTVAVQGFSADGKQIWKPNMVIEIDDDYAGIKSRMKIRSVDFNLAKNGTFTSIQFVSPDAYDNVDVKTILSPYDVEPTRAFDLEAFLRPVTEEELNQ